MDAIRLIFRTRNAKLGYLTSLYYNTCPSKKKACLSQRFGKIYWKLPRQFFLEPQKILYAFSLFADGNLKIRTLYYAVRKNLFSLEES
jgi:hypothetical protein